MNPADSNPTVPHTSAWRSLVERGIFVYQSGEIDTNRSICPGTGIYRKDSDAQAAFQQLMDAGDPAAVELFPLIVRARFLSRK